VIYHAGTDIDLYPEFAVALGANFTAAINPCSVGVARLKTPKGYDKKYLCNNKRSEHRKVNYWLKEDGNSRRE